MSGYFTMYNFAPQCLWSPCDTKVLTTTIIVFDTSPVACAGPWVSLLQKKGLFVREAIGLQNPTRHERSSQSASFGETGCCARTGQIQVKGWDLGAATLVAKLCNTRSTLRENSKEKLPSQLGFRQKYSFLILE